MFSVWILLQKLAFNSNFWLYRAASHIPPNNAMGLGIQCPVRVSHTHSHIHITPSHTKLQPYLITNMQMKFLTQHSVKGYRARTNSQRTMHAKGQTNFIFADVVRNYCKINWFLCWARGCVSNPNGLNVIADMRVGLWSAAVWLKAQCDGRMESVYSRCENKRTEWLVNSVGERWVILIWAIQ